MRCKGPSHHAWAGERTPWGLVFETVLTKARGHSFVTCKMGPGWATEFMGPQNKNVKPFVKKIITALKMTAEL